MRNRSNLTSDNSTLEDLLQVYYTKVHCRLAKMVSYAIHSAPDLLCSESLLETVAWSAQISPILTSIGALCRHDVSFWIIEYKPFVRMFNVPKICFKKWYTNILYYINRIYEYSHKYI